MTLRYLSGASIVTVLAGGLIAAAPAYAQNVDLIPRDESAVITVSGCLLHDGKRFILGNPRLGTVANVPNGACDAAIDANSLELEDANDHGINNGLVGNWVEINGRLEKEESSDPSNLREMKVRSFRVIPVVPPQRAEAIPAPVFEAPAPAPAPVPVPTTGVAPTAIEEPLPRTASPLAMIGLLGLLSVAGSVGLRYYRSRVRG